MKQMIVKKGSFASCHRISNHKGKCHNLHGHNYNYEIGYIYDLESTEFNECNYVVDFGEIKNTFQHWIDTFFDHSVIVNEKDKDVIELAKKINDHTRVLLTRGDPSVEVISQMLMYLCYRVGESKNVVKESTIDINYIKVYGTDNSYCELRNTEYGGYVNISSQFKELLSEYL